jgi:hypothetical protein
MSFFETSINVTLNASILNAQCEGNDGQFHDSSLDLNNVFGNINGSFVSPGSGWFTSAENSALNGRILQAGLLNEANQSVFAQVNLDR